MASTSVPDDFPRSVAIGAVPGSQPKLLVREEAGRFVAEGATNLEMQAHYEVCEDLVQQLVQYTARKQAERPDWTPAQLREKVAASVLRKGFGWGLSPAEAQWIVGRLAATEAGPPAGSATS